jgi:integrase
VIPKNWHTTKASVKTPWRGYYNFHDPAQKHIKKYKYGKQVKILGMNRHITLEERQAITRNLISDEEYQLQVLGFNPITKSYMAPKAVIPRNVTWEIAPDTPLILALERTLFYCYSEEAINLMISDNYQFRRLNNLDVVYKDDQLMVDESGYPSSLIAAISSYIKQRDLKPEIEDETVTDIKSTLKYFGQSATILLLDQAPLSKVKSKEIKAILDNCKNLIVEKIVNKKIEVDGKFVVQKHNINGKLVPIKEVVKKVKVWNDNQFNHYRKYLRVLFSKINKLEVLEYNPIDNLDIKNSTPEDEDPDAYSRKVLTPEERRTIHVILITQFPEFHRLIHIFYHSGARRKEIMKVQGKHVDLAGQRFKVLVKKGKSRWKWKTIKDAALPTGKKQWKDVVQKIMYSRRAYEQAPIRSGQNKSLGAGGSTLKRN